MTTQEMSVMAIVLSQGQNASALQFGELRDGPMLIASLRTDPSTMGDAAAVAANMAAIDASGVDEVVILSGAQTYDMQAMIDAHRASGAQITIAADANPAITIYSWPWLRAALMMDAMEPDSTHTFAQDILPLAVDMGLARDHRQPRNWMMAKPAPAALSVQH